MSANVSADVKQRFGVKLREYLPEQLADGLANHATLVTYAPGSFPFTQGSAADLIFWVVSGYVKIYCPVRERDRILVRIAGPGDVLGCTNVMGPAGDVSQAFDAQTMTSCTLALSPRQSVLRFIENLDQASILSLMERMNASWSAFARRLVTFSGLPFRERLEFAFEELASRFGVRDERGVLLAMRLSHAELAQMIDSSRPMVTRLIGEMIADGSLHRLGKYYAIPGSTASPPTAGQKPTSFGTAVSNGPNAPLKLVKTRELGSLQERRGLIMGRPALTSAPKAR